MLDQNKDAYIELSGLIEKITFCNDDNGFHVFKLLLEQNNSKNLVTVIGFSCNLKPGEYAHCKGNWVKDKVYGSQFKATEIHLLQPTSKIGIEKYLSSGLIKGVGPGFAKRLVAIFGDQTLNIIANTPEKLLNIAGIGAKRYHTILENWSAQKEIREIMLFLHQHGIGTARAMRIYKVYKEQAIAKIKENPYRLAADIYGIGFKLADKLALSLGIAQNSIMRAAAGIRFMLQQWTLNGHCAISQQELIKITQEKLEISEDIIIAAIAGEEETNSIVVEKIKHDDLDSISGENLIFLKSIYVAESYIPAKVFELQQGKPSWINSINVENEIALMEQYAKIKFSNSQLRAIKTAIEVKFVIITGGPGVGKTTVARSILHLISAKTNKVLLCAPTGKSAKRLAESTNMPASTLHRALAFDGSSNKFKYNEDNLLDINLILIDEFSMVDLLMFANVLKALPKHCCVILMGDLDQLPSVGVGAVLADLINSDCITTVRLEEIFRQSANSNIIINAHRINKGKLPILENITAPTSPKAPTDFYFIKLANHSMIHHKILQIIERLKLKFSFDLLKDVQILSPMNKGSGGVIALNVLLQNALNPNIKKLDLKVSKFGNDFIVKDKVIQNINNYDKEVFNGDLGIIESIDLEESTMIINFDGRMVSYDFDDLDEINLAYAITIHKSQGSEYPVVIIPISLQHYTLLQRNLIYTAVTRGKSLVVLLGEIKALAIAVHNQGSTRVTRLKERLIKEFLQH